MMLVDTNVISEVMKTAPSAVVVGWLNAQAPGSLYLSAVTIGEIEFGLCILPVGNRRTRLKDRFERFVSLAFVQRVLAVDEPCARPYGEIMDLRREMGRPMTVPDGQIAAIARAKGLGIATRNTRDFENCGVDLIDPFANGP